MIICVLYKSPYVKAHSLHPNQNNVCPVARKRINTVISARKKDIPVFDLLYIDLNEAKYDGQPETKTINV